MQHSWYERLFNLISVVKPGEGRSCLLLTIIVALLMSTFYLLKVVREPLILAYGGAEYKSYATAFQAGLMVLIVPMFSMMYHRYKDRKQRNAVINRVLLFFISHLLFFALLQFLNVNVGMAFYVWLGIFGVMVLAQFWAFAADSYNVRSGQRLFVILAVGATFGSWFGSRIAGPIFPVIGIVGIMLLATLFLVLVVFLTDKIDPCIPEGSINKEVAKPDRQVNHWLDGFSIVLKNNYLLLIAAFVMLLVFLNSTGEYILARFVSEYSLSLLHSKQISDVQAWQGQFYSSYYSWITLGSFLLQLFVVSRVFEWLGLRGGLLIPPLVIILGYSLMAFFPVFSLVRFVMTAENSVNYSLQNTTHQALFLPVPRKLKYLGKTTIDTFFYRVGDLLYGGFIFVGTQVYSLSISSFILCNLILAFGLLVLAWHVNTANTLEVQKRAGNSAPFIKAAIPRIQVPSGNLSEFSISENTFVDTDIGDALKFYALQESGQPLPDWIIFDRMSRTFSFEPPEDYEGNLNIQVVATDFDGATVKANLKVSFYCESEHSEGQ
ncbi:putative Ig domain-containing protein [Paraglaciecola aestuariivivens]